MESESTAKYCWKCGSPIESTRIGFRAECESCHAWLHCCKGCRNYAPGRPNDCAIPGTEQIADREAANFCDEFAIALKKPPLTGTSDPFEALFK
jgi:hypothetical protein